MKRVLLAGVAILALVGSAFAQSTTITRSPEPSSVAVLTIPQEQRAIIMRFVVQAKVQPVTIKEHIGIGTSLPDDVELLAIPNDWGLELTRYRYVVSHSHVFLVEPFSRRVVQIIN